MRLGPGPVFVYEWLTTTRRWQLYAMRVLFVGAILAGLAFVLHQMMSYRVARETVSLQELAEFGEAIYLTIATVELTLVLLAAPAATAGAVCLDKARGTLDHMLATDLSNAEIVLGKLGVRLIPVLGLIVCVLPVVALSGLMGGIDPLALFGSFLVAIGCALVGCALAMTLSVWARKTHEVVMMTYILIVIWLIFPGLVAMVMWLLGARRPPPFSAPVFMAVAHRHESVLSRLRTLYGPGQGGPVDVPGLPGRVPGDQRRTGGPVDGADPPRGPEAGRPPGGGSAPASAAAPPSADLAAEAPRPVAGLQPGGLARVAPHAPVLDDADRLGPVRGPGRVLVR